MKNKIFSILIFIICFQSFAQELPNSVEAILKQVMASDGYLTKQMHQKFWQEIHNIGNKQEVARLEKGLKVNLLHAQEFQKELWSSIKLSYENKKITKTDRLIELEKEMPIKFREALTMQFPKNSLDYKIALITFEKSNKTSMDSAKRFLKAAATRQPVRSHSTIRKGEVYNIDMKLIEHVLNNLHSTFNRINNLMNQNWSPK